MPRKNSSILLRASLLTAALLAVLVGIANAGYINMSATLENVAPPITVRPSTSVEVDLERVPDGTVIRLREHGYQDTPSGRLACLNCAAGWGEALTLLKFFVEHGLRY